MIQNISITKNGSEADNAEKTIFSSEVSWESGGANLCVYLNGLILSKAEFSVLDFNRIQVGQALVDTDEITLIITKFTTNTGTELDSAALDRVSKTLEGKAQTSIGKKVYEESISTHIIMHSDEIWSTDIPPLPEDGESLGVAFKYELFSLTEDVTVPNKQGWYVSSDGALSGKIPDWIPPKFGQGYTPRLFDANDVEITSSSPVNWSWDCAAGYLFLENPHIYETPFKISGYTYTGDYGGGGGSSSSSSHWKSPVPTTAGLPNYGNVEGDIRLVLDENVFYRWKTSETRWVPSTFSSERFKDPALDFDSLPTEDNHDADIRLVISLNGLFRWVEADEEWVPVTTPHNHDEDYYKKEYLDTQLSEKSDINHEHHASYYEKTEVDAMVRWRPPVATEADLPPYSENLDGDVMMTLDTKTIWRFDYFGYNQGEWIPIMTSRLYWMEPVDSIDDMPDDPIVGEVHLVVTQGKSYFWTGTSWEQITGIEEHDHDERYYLKEDIFWKYPVADKDSLPTDGNAEGDVRITLDNSDIYRYEGGAWVLISASPKWRDPVETMGLMPTSGNAENDIRVVIDENSIYRWSVDDGMWVTIFDSAHDHDDRYYTENELMHGALDSVYYSQDAIDEMFDTQSGHSHDGIDSAPILWDSVVGKPHFYWQTPVVNITDLPYSGNETGDARIVLNEAKIYYWNGAIWDIISRKDVPAHDHDEQYYKQSTIDQIINDVEMWATNQLAAKADLDHTHDSRYYQKSEVDDEFESRFDPDNGHDHNGVDSKRISYYDLEDVPPLNAHNHDSLYYRKEQLQTPGEALVDWMNVSQKPDLANGHWKSPVQTKDDLPMIDNDLYDIRIVLDDSDIYEWDGMSWNFVGHWDNKYVNYWKEPVDSFDDLPLTGNVTGEVRLILDENMLYRWDGDDQRWKLISTSSTDLQVYYNGLLLVPDVDYVRVKEKAAKILFNVEGGSLISLVVTGDTFLRKDFTAYAGQEYFEIVNKYHRQDWISRVGQTQFTVDVNYTVGGNQLLVWLNGDLQLVGDDYVELTHTTFQFFEPVNIEDHITAIVMETASGEGEFVREDQYATSGQSMFVLENFFIPGSNSLLVYYNGQLLKCNEDYIEISSSSIETLNLPCRKGEHFTFIILSTGVSGGGNAKDIILGIPTDKTYKDGLLDFYEETKVNDAIDEINEVLLDVAPDPPEPIMNRALVPQDMTLYSGYVSEGNINYEYAAGRYHTYLTEASSFTLMTDNGTSFGSADKGEMRLFVNDAQVDAFDLYAAFVEDSSDGLQSAASYGQSAQGARDDVGVSGSNGAIRNSDNGYLSIMSIQKYNDFRRWQIGKIRINILVQLLRKGYNRIHLEHILDDDEVSRSSTMEFFFDTAGARPYLDTRMKLTEVSMISAKYVSGIRYYSIGDVFNVQFDAIRVFNNTYAQVPVQLDMPGLQPKDIEFDHEDVSGPADPPRIGDFFSFDGDITLNEYNEFSTDARLTISTFDPFGPGDEQMTSSTQNLLNTYTNGSTDLIEYFRDERYRLPYGDYDIIPHDRSGQWDSQALLEERNALLFDNKLQFAHTDFSGYKPAQTADYSTHTLAQYYWRAFYKRTAKNAGTFTIEGLNIAELTTDSILIDIKLPGQTGWLSLNKPYDVSVFTGIEGDGCLLKSEGNQFTYSSGTFSTAHSGYMIVVRIVLPNATAPQISYMELDW